MFKNKQLYIFSRVLISSLGLMFVSTSVPAFEGDEHNDISNLAFKIALDYNCPEEATTKSTNNRNCQAVRAASASLTNKQEEFSYGRINELVDYMHYPEQIFEHYNYDIEYPSSNIAESPKHLNEHALSIREDQLNKLALFDYLSASSHNERHFQDALMQTMHYLHKSAVIDAQKGHIYNALVKNSLSDHYLNDFFAPGHITTARENSHDTVALAMHDRANKAGSCFLIDNDYWNELKPILSFIKTATHKSVINRNSEKEIDTIVANLKECDRKISEADNFKQILTKKGANSREFQQSIIDFLAENHKTIYLQGDGHLHQNPVQQLFMILVQVKSISEVMQAYLHCDNGRGTQCNDTYLTNYRWKGSYDSESKDGTGVVPPEAKTEFGRYNITYNSDDENENETVSVFLDRPKFAYPTIADNAFLISIGGQTPVSQESSRFQTQFELFPLQIGTSNQFDSLRDMTIHRPSTDCIFWCNLGLAYGLSYINDDYFEASGIQLRVIKAYPKISTLLSAIVRRGRYRGEIEKQTKTTYGIRYDHGFSLHSFYIGYEWDYGYDQNNAFHDENVITFGWTLSFPSSRFLGY
jgi:hypothetical protein